VGLAGVLGWTASYGAGGSGFVLDRRDFKETQLRHIASGDTAIISLMGNEDLPFKGTVRSMGWGIFVTDGSSGQSTALLPSVSPTIDSVRLPQRFPVRIQVDGLAPVELRMGQTVSVAISHGPQAAAFLNRLTSIGLPARRESGAQREMRPLRRNVTPTSDRIP
jgi:hypothetical protein